MQLEHYEGRCIVSCVQAAIAVAADSIFALDDVAKESVAKVAKAIDEGDPRAALEASKMEGKEAGA
ncbi:MAG: hypothetical protein CM15mV148_160 [uncultured marine virus]|nr:MAG: hypothetical protein CM15mV148_160 [uncultured marine virus]